MLKKFKNKKGCSPFVLSPMKFFQSRSLLMETRKKMPDYAEKEIYRQAEEERHQEIDGILFHAEQANLPAPAHERDSTF